MRDWPVSFFVCIEPDNNCSLINNSISLIESIRLFGGEFAGCPIYTISPRGRIIPCETKQRLYELGVIHAELNLNLEYSNYPHANKIYAGAYLEQIARTEILVFLDSDSVILNEPAEFRLPPGVDIGVTPVWLKGIGCSDDRDLSAHLWKIAYSVVAKKIPKDFVLTRIGQETILPYYNSGMIVARRSSGFFHIWQSVFERLVSSDQVMDVLCAVSGTNDYLYRPQMFADQLSLAVTISDWDSRLKEFSALYNCPLHHKNKLSDNFQNMKFDLESVVHWHHNNYLGSPYVLGIVSDGSCMQSAKRQWIESRCFINPPLSGADNERFFEYFNNSMMAWRNAIAEMLQKDMR
ncbi:MAG TPA: hypothetical protein VMV75_10045 [Sulfuricella sp.]|nr:hypothetical protein [Sulfuricella sp.]